MAMSMDTLVTALLDLSGNFQNFPRRCSLVAGLVCT